MAYVYAYHSWSSFRFGKKSTSLPTYEGRNTSPPTYENRFFYPLNFIKQANSPPEAVLKNYIKSQKNHKMETPIVLDSK
jgi:hypothetical protein